MSDELSELKERYARLQLLHQVSGRAGRAEAPGKVLLQTFSPDHPVMQAIVASDREAFLNHEILVRQSAMLPPYGRLVALVVSAKHRDVAQGFAREVARRAPAAEQIELLGPAEAPIAIIRGRYRWRLLLKAPRETDVQAYIREWLALLPEVKGDIKLTVDIDPYSFL